MNTNLVKFIHRGCGDIAYWATHKPVTGELVSDSWLLNIDLSPVHNGERMRCGSCGDFLTQVDIQVENFVEQ